MPKFLIIVSVFNVEQYLSRCLDSLINQTCQNLKIICINDGSINNSLQILEKYVQKNFRIKIFNQEYQGVSDARNNALDNVTRDYIRFINSDDCLELNIFIFYILKIIYLFCKYRIVLLYRKSYVKR